MAFFIPENAFLTSSIDPHTARSQTGTVLRARTIGHIPGVEKYDCVITGERSFLLPIFDIKISGSTSAGWFGKTMTGTLVSKSSWFLKVILYRRASIFLAIKKRKRSMWWLFIKLDSWWIWIDREWLLQRSYIQVLFLQWYR